MKRLSRIVLVATLCLSFFGVGSGMAKAGGKLCPTMMTVSRLQPMTSGNHTCCCCANEKEQKYSCSDIKSRCEVNAQTFPPVSASETQIIALSETPGDVISLPLPTEDRQAFMLVSVRETTYLTKLSFRC